MYSFIWLLILAHMIGDFVLQTNRVAKMKATSQKGLLLHFCLITGTQMVLMGIYYGLLGISAAIIVGLIHGFIDYSKVKITDKFKYQSIYFILDQVMHILTIVVVAWLLNPGNSKYEINMHLLALNVMIIMAAYVLSILVQFLLMDFQLSKNRVAFFQPYERSIDSITALMVLFILNVDQLYALAAILPIGIAYGLIEGRRYGYSTKAIGMKFLVFVVFALSTSYIL